MADKELLKKAHAQAEQTRSIGVPETTRMFQRAWAELSQKGLAAEEKEALAKSYGAEILCLFNGYRRLYEEAIEANSKQRQTPGGRDLPEVKYGDELEFGVGKLKFVVSTDEEYPTITAVCNSRREDIKIRGLFVPCDGLVASGVNMEYVLKPLVEGGDTQHYSVKIENGGIKWINRWRFASKGNRKVSAKFLKV